MMTAEMLAKVRRSLIEHEQLRFHPYVDTVGKITIGIGYNLTDRGIDEDWINKQFYDDVDYFDKQFSQYPWWETINEDRKILLIDMAFMGWKRLLQFKDMFDALEKDDYKGAAFAMLNSEWAMEVHNRAAQLAQGMLTGVYNI